MRLGSKRGASSVISNKLPRSAKRFSRISQYGLSGGRFLFGKAAVKPVLPLPNQNEAQIRTKPAFMKNFNGDWGSRG